MADFERKILSFRGEFKAVSGDEDGTFEGYGSIFNNIDSYSDVVVPGAFYDSLKDFGVPACLWQHDWRKPIGIYTEVREDAKGLYVKGKLNLETQQGKEAYALLKQGALKGLSIGYGTDTSELDDTLKVRKIKKATLYEVSIVTFPANRLANVTAVKSAPVTEREFEEFLRDAGYSAKMAKTIIAKGYRAAMEGEQDAAISESEEAIVAAIKAITSNIKS